MSTPTVQEVAPTRNGAMLVREAYHAPSDMYVALESVDSKSRAIVLHPLHGRIRVPCNELREV